MKLTGNKIFSFMWAAAFALTLAGCGGGGGGASDDTMTTPSVPDQAIMAAKDAAAEAAAAATAALNAAKKAVDGAGADQDYDAVHYALATTELGKAKDAKAAADAANEKAQAADTLKAAEAARDDALEAQAAAEAAQADAEMFAKAVADAKKAAPPASSDQARFEARLALADAKTETASAVAAAGAAVRATKAAARAAAAAVTKATKARTNAAGAEAAKKAADQAAKDAAAAKKTADAAKAAVAKLNDDDIGAKKGAADLESAADAAAGNAATAMRKANEAEAAAEKARDDAMAAANTHVLGLFKAANGDDITFVGSEDDADIASALGKAKSARREAVIEAIGDAAGDRPGAEVVIEWPADVAANPDAEPPTEAMPGALKITVTPTGGSEIPFRTEAVEDDPITDLDESMPKTATKIDGLRGFMHGYSVSDGGSHTIVFTDKEQAKPAVVEKSVALANAPLVLSQIEAQEDITLDADDLNNTAAYDHDGDPDTLPLTGIFATCMDAAGCISTVDGKITGAVAQNQRIFSGTGVIVEAADEAENNDYLAFGVWLRVDEDGDTDGEQPAVGVFADGGTPFATSAALIGTATYRGAATGVYTAGSRVDYFQGSATLTANFGTKPEMGEDDMTGTITGMIHDIEAGGVRTGDVIRLNTDVNIMDGAPVLVDNITADGGFTGNARMGAVTEVDNVAIYTHNGAWGGRFYGPQADTDATGVDALPPAVAGAFGVTGATGEGDAAVTRSYVGAFGARR